MVAFYGRDWLPIAFTDPAWRALPCRELRRLGIDACSILIAYEHLRSGRRQQRRRLPDRNMLLPCQAPVGCCRFCPLQRLLDGWSEEWLLREPGPIGSTDRPDSSGLTVDKLGLAASLLQSAPELGHYRLKGI